MAMRVAFLLWAVLLGSAALTTEVLGAVSDEGLPTLDGTEPMPVDEPIRDMPDEEEIEEEEVEEPLPGMERREGYLRSPTTCPTDIETLTALLIRDVPNYSNRVLQRTVAVLPNNNDDSPVRNGILKQPYRPSYVLIAGRPELEPLDLNQYALTTDSRAGGPLTQVFFTTLSRQYSGLRFDEVQEYHWLFLAESADGWWLSFMFSAIDDVDTARAPLPPRENSEGTVGQAVRLWLRDCRAGAIDRLE